MKKYFPAAVILASTFWFSACSPKSDSDDSKDLAEESNNAKFDSRMEQDTEFAVAAADGGLLEVQLGLLAQHNSLTPEVKQLGQMMVDEHTKANEELRNIAFKKDISIPTRLSEKNQKKYDELSEKTGDDFDRAYTEFMVKDHNEDIDNFKKQFDKGEDNELRTWASDKVPTLEHHLEMAEQAERIVKNSRARTSRD